MAVTRRRFLGGAAAAAFAAGWPYRLVDRIAGPTPRDTGAELLADHSGALPLEQHLVNGLRTVVDGGTPVTVPPLHHAVVTAVLDLPATTVALQQAQQALESVLVGLEAARLLTFRPTGLSLAVAWGLPYFRRLPSTLTGGLLPVDLDASGSTGTTTPALLDAIAFASDPTDLLLEQNDVAFVLASDHLADIASAVDAVVNGPAGALFQVTSLRRGFVDARPVGTGVESLTTRMAKAAGVPGAKSIPESAQLFLGFTSTQQAALGPSTIANLESLPGMTDQWPDGYFRHGTAMHLSHIFEDLESWYGVGYRQRATFSINPSVRPHRGTQTIPQGPGQTESLAQVQADYGTYRFVGHSASMQPVSRLPGPVTDNYGNLYPAGTAIPQRADFNTLDNPFSYSADPLGDRMSPLPAAGVHFLAFTPTSGSFHQLRHAMDGQYGPDGDLGFEAVHGPFNNILRTTHRQNYLVPPRVHRSFPLAELLD